MTTSWHILDYSSVNYYIDRKGACCNVSSKFFFSARPINIYWRASWLSCRRPLLVPTFQSYFLSCSHPILSFTLFPHSQDISTPWNISKSQNIFVLAKYFHTFNNLTLSGTMDRTCCSTTVCTEVATQTISQYSPTWTRILFLSMWVKLLNIQTLQYSKYSFTFSTVVVYNFTPLP